ILKEGYTALEELLIDLINKTSLIPQQVMDGWHKTQGHIINGVNHWNVFSRYLSKHEAQE
ncbi:hypothetical protein HD554DRAFT_2021722, partial [Boletus coccyginus]